MSCENGCYEAQVNGCGNITIKAGLTPALAYFVSLSKNSNENVYQRQVTADGDGNLVISKANYPAGYFSGGHFRLTIRVASTYALQPIIFNSISFNCVLFKIVNTDIEISDTSPIGTIQ